MKRLIVRFGLVCACGLAAAAAGGAATLPTDGSWYDSGLVIMPGPGTFFPDSITATAAAIVDITGYWDNTDQYDVFVNGNLVLATPSISPPGPPTDYGDSFGTYTTPALAWGSGLFSSGTFQVQSGDVITIEDIGRMFPDPAFGGFDAQVGLFAVPEPADFALTALGLMGVGVWRLRRRWGSRSPVSPRL